MALASGSWWTSRVSSATSGGGPTAAPGALFGRDAELERLRTLIAEGRSVVLTGEPGIGKTALLRVLGTEHPAHVGGALGLLGFLPYLALVRAVGSLPDAEPAVLAREVVRRVGADGLLVLDDLHWADDGTLDVMGRLVGAVTVLSAVRSTDRAARRVIRRLEALRCEVVEVPPLGDDVAARLARHRSPRLSPVAVREVVARAGGNALLVEELARSGVTTSLRRAVQHRLRGLDRPARSLLEMLAVAGEPLEIRPVTPALRRLESLALVETDERGTATRHALIAEVVVEDLSPARSAALHRVVARRSRDPLTAARHLVAAGDRAAARTAALSAIPDAPPGRSAVLAGIAAECADGPFATTEQVEAARQLVDAGWFREAERILDLAQPSMPIDRARLLAVRAHTRWGLGDADGAVAAAEEGLTELARLPISKAEAEARDLRAGLLVDRAWSVTLQRNAGQAVPLAHEALEAVSAAGLPTGPANRVLALALSIAGAPFDETMPYLETALAEARAAGDVAEELLCGKLVVAGHEGGGDGAEGRRLGEAFVARARAAGMVAWEQSIRATLVSLANGQGQYARAITEGTDLLAEPLERRTRSQAAGYLSLALVDMGRLDEADRLIEDALAMAPDDVDGRLDLLWAQVELAVASGAPRRADSLAAAILEEFKAADYCDLRHVRVTQAWARYEMGRDPGAPIPAIEMHAHVRGTVPESHAVRLLGLASEDATVTSLIEAAALFASAATEHAPFHRRSELRCRWAQGEALRRAGRTDEARGVLLAAEQAAGELGLVPLGGRIRRSLRLVGERRHAPRRAGGRVTAREREVLDLVSAGLTNAQIAARLGIGRPTVARLVTNAATKLGTTSRAQTVAHASEVD